MRDQPDGTVVGGHPSGRATGEDQRPGNHWRLRQYSMLLGFHSSVGASVADCSYADLFSGYFSAARRLVDGGLLNSHEFVGFRPLIVNP